jgi:hypothetical protein
MGRVCGYPLFKRRHGAAATEFAYRARRAEKQTAEQLLRLMGQYDLSKWIVTRDIDIDEDAIPHSNPVLTLHTRHLKDDALLLSTFVHEQMHRYLAQHPEDFAQAVAELRKLYPKTPVGYPQGSDTEAVNYEHFLVIDLEWQADRELFGELAARQVMEFWAHDHYTWIYQTVLDHRRQFDDVVRKYHLLRGV